MRMYKYGKVHAIRAVDMTDGKVDNHLSSRTPQKAIDEKIKVLREFYVVDTRNEDAVREKLEKAIAERPDVHFDTVIDRIAKQMIAEKLGE